MRGLEPENHGSLDSEWYIALPPLFAWFCYMLSTFLKSVPRKIMGQVTYIVYTTTVGRSNLHGLEILRPLHLQAGHFHGSDKSSNFQKKSFQNYVVSMLRCISGFCVVVVRSNSCHSLQPTHQCRQFGLHYSTQSQHFLFFSLSTLSSLKIRSLRSP